MLLDLFTHFYNSPLFFCRRDGQCDIRRRPCRQVNVIVDNIMESSHLACRVTPLDVSRLQINLEYACTQIFLMILGHLRFSGKHYLRPTSVIHRDFGTAFIRDLICLNYGNITCKFTKQLIDRSLSKNEHGVRSNDIKKNFYC